MKNNLFFLFILFLPFVVHSQNLESCSIIDLPFSGNAQDVSGNDNHGTIYGATLTEDRHGNPNSAYYFDGVDDYIEVVSDDMNLGLRDYTVSVWFRRDSYGDHFIFSKERRSDNTINRYAGGILSNAVLSVDNNFLYFREAEGPASPTWNTTNGFNFEYQETVELEEWHHLVIRREDLDLTMYINGEVVSEFSFASKIDLTNSLNLRIGARYATGSGDGATDIFKGAIDDFKMYNCALDDNEILDLYNGVSSSSAVVLQEEDINVYPNPANSHIFIKNKSNLSAERIVLYNSSGQEIKSQIFTNEAIQKMNINGLPTGVYFLKIGKNYAKKIVITQPRA